MSTKTQTNRKSISGLRTALLLGAAASAALTLSSAAFAADQPVETVTVTGTLIQGNTNLVSPVTVIDTSSLDKSGISSIQSALQQTLANNGPAVTNNWTANGNFAQGASAVSLRGLTTNSTLVLFDGMRAAYYPLADDGTRNFVDLNTIPDDIVENIQILRDGASSSYGADAIAGVINIITKKEFQGLSARAEGGISDRGDAATWKFSATAGVGDLSKDKINFYVSASYFHSDVLHNSSRGYPFNTSDWSNVCWTNPDPAIGRNCSNTSWYGYPNFTRNPDGSLAFSTQGEFAVRPGTHNANGSFTALAGSTYQNLNSNCGKGTSYTLNATDRSGAGAIDPTSVCQYDISKLYGSIEPMQTRFGLTGHTAFQLPNSMEGYVEANYMQDTVSYFGTPAGLYANAPAGIYYPQFRTAGAGGGAYVAGSETLYLPVWVCPERVNCSTSANKTLNPNNPFANADPTLAHDARVVGRDMDYQTFTETRSRTYRVAANLNGSFLDNWRFDVGLTAMHVDLRYMQNGYVYIQHLLNVIADGSYNFVDPSKNNTPLTQLAGQTANQYLHPDNINNASSDMAEAKTSITAPLYKLPGGDLTVVVGADIRYEAIDDPSANSDINGPTERWFTINAVGAKGSRDVYSAFFEINAPIFEELVLNASGRYDSYSSGQSNFSPKFGFWSKPIDWLTLKGAYSEGFRIPSFSEANALPTTGYVSNTKSLFNNTFLAQYGCTLATFSTCPVYLSSSSYGQTTLATPTLQPEKSRSWTADLVLQPLDELQISTTYYNIKKTGAIVSPNFADGATAYYAGQPIPSAFVVVPDAPDPSYPNATPRAAFVRAHLINANTVRTAGWDFAVTYDSDLDPVENMIGVFDTLGTVHMNSTVQATFIQNLDTVFPDGTIQRFDGTLGNFGFTAGTGTPKWRGLWQTNFSTDRVEFTSTLNWNSGYNLSAMDSGTGYRDCGLSDGSVPCRIADYFTWDVNAQYKLDSNIKVYFTVNNVLDAMPPVDTIATYGITGYNAVVGGDGILGRYLKMGIKLDY